MQKAPVLVTGATSGLGRKTAIALARAGWPVVVGGRRTELVNELVTEIKTLGVDASPFVADQADLDQLREAIQSLGETELGGVIANAGITTEQNLKTKQGFEITFGVNVLSHQLLLREIADNLRENSRIVILSSGVHEPDHKLARRTGIPIPEWLGTRELAYLNAESERPDFEGRRRYSTSKLGNVIQARGLQEWLNRKGKSIDVFAVDPGLMVDTELARELPGLLKLIFQGVGRMLTPFIDNMRLSDVSAGHLLSLIQDAKWRGLGFSYLDGNTIKPPSPDAQRDDLMEEFWSESEKILSAA